MNIFNTVFKTCTTTLLLVLFSIIGYGQEVQMADTMRSEGKIYVVVVVLVIIFLGLFGFLFAIDKKVKKIENELEQ